MSTRTELEAALAQAEAGWSKANEELELAQAARARANADWDNVVTVQHEQEVDRRKAVDRRSADATWDMAFDRRNPDADRRKSRATFVAFSKAVADRHEAYIARSNAEADWAEAEARVRRAGAQREKAKAALDELNRA